VQQFLPRRYNPTMLVALTGASGFIGSYTAAALKQAHAVRALVRSTSRRDHIEQHVDEFVEGEQSDVSALERLVQGVDAVVHSSVDWRARERSPMQNFQSNMLGSLALLEATRLAGVRQFIFVSSAAVYHEIPASAEGRITEETVTWPQGTYGAYKAAIEAHLKAYHFEYGMNTSAWRPAAVYGLNPTLKRSQWFGLIDAARRGERIATSAGGKITHVQDVADALALAVGECGVAGQFYNLAERYMYWQVAAELAKELSESDAPIEDCKGSGPRNQFDTSKAVAFFDRHHRHEGLRRGIVGVRHYVQALLRAM
jgi:nucleoside-diphosphate-sugar epimerase